MMIQSSTRLTGEAAAALGKSAPPVAVVGATISGLTLQDWVYILTIVWLIAQTTALGWKSFREWRGRKVADDE